MGRNEHVISVAVTKRNNILGNLKPDWGWLEWVLLKHNTKRWLRREPGAAQKMDLKIKLLVMLRQHLTIILH